MTQPAFSFTPALQPSFDSGITLTPADQIRLTGQIARVLTVLQDGRPYTVAMINARTGDPEPSISAQLRNLRKTKHGAHDVKRTRVDNLSYYRLVRTT